MTAQHFRAGVVIAVVHPDGRQVMAFERAEAVGRWQFPQGGLEPGEEPIDAAWRELGEETGLGPTDVVARDELSEWLAYEWPAATRAAGGWPPRGQVHRWFLFEARHASIEPALDAQVFRSWRWVDPAWLIDAVIEFRRTNYRRALEAWFIGS